MTKQVHDLRSALALLEAMPGELVKTQIPVALTAELAGVYRRVGAGGTVRRPTRWPASSRRRSRKSAFS